MKNYFSLKKKKHGWEEIVIWPTIGKNKDKGGKEKFVQKLGNE